MTAPEKAGDRLLLGEIGAAHGLRGELRLTAYTGDPAAIGSYGPLEDETGTRRFEIENLRAGPKGVVAKLKGVDDRTAAERLTGTKLYVARDRLPESGEDEFYYADLIGLAAFDTAGAALGTVIALHNFGAGDLIELAPSDGGPTLLIPFTEAAVPEIDIEAGRLTVDPPEGLLE